LTDVAQIESDAREVIAAINSNLKKWESWFPNDMSDVEVPRRQLLALRHFAEIGLQMSCDKPAELITGKLPAPEKFAIGQSVILKGCQYRGVVENAFEGDVYLVKTRDLNGIDFHVRRHSEALEAIEEQS
jgi:hypothetical protein